MRTLRKGSRLMPLLIAMVVTLSLVTGCDGGAEETGHGGIRRGQDA